ncbi:MAG: GNAT family N-acetyltransferase [Promethearchaeota archaeon]
MVNFVKMTEHEFTDYLEFLIADYSKDYAQIKEVSIEEARSQTELQIEALLPNGYVTPDVFIGFIQDKYQNIGYIWFIHELRKQYTFLADIEIFPDYRNKGLGTLALKSLAKEVKELGFKAIVLHVFKHNVSAKRLYEKLGYTVIQEIDTGFNMAKKF